MTRSSRPVAPDAAFATLFASPSTYGFYMRRSDNEDVQSIINDPERWVILNLAPQSITWREPNATSITPTQGGGKIVESSGHVLRYGQISGTTGYLPPEQVQGSPIPPRTPGGSRAPLVSDDPDLDLRLGMLSGFYKFAKLRHLFRLYAHERRRGNLNVTFHYMDVLNDEFWRVEPTEFVMRRTKGRPFMRDYDISITAIEPSDAVALTAGHQVQSFLLPVYDPNMTVLSVNNEYTYTRAGADTLRAYNDNSTLLAINRLKTLNNAGLGFVQRLSGSVQRRFQDALRDVSAVTQFFDNIHSAFTTLLDLPIALLTQLRGAIDSVISVADQFSSDNIREELNEWWLEVTGLIDGITTSISDLTRTNDRARVFETDRDFSVGRARQGFTTDLMREPDGGTGSPDANPYLGTSGLGLVTDVAALANTTRLRAVPIYDNDTIWSIALRIYGDMARFIDLVLLNDLAAPYIVSGTANRPANTLAWGESIMVPADTDESSSDTASLVRAAPVQVGVVTATGISTELVDENDHLPVWRVDQWIGYTVTLRPGTATEEQRVVVSNTASRLQLNLAWSTAPVVDDAYTLTLVIFDVRRPATPEARAYGRDFLLVFNSKNGVDQYGKPKATIVLNQRGDLAMATGLDNLIQSANLRLRTELGRHPFHASFGIALPVGRPWSLATALFYTYFVRRSLLQDPRIASVSKARITLEQSTIMFSAEIHPTQSRKARRVDVAAR